MYRYWFLLKYSLLILLISTYACSSPVNTQKEITIAVAANMQFATKAIVKKFEESHSFKCNLVISSSGKLTSQIKAGAPFDLFISANMTYPQNLYSQGYTTQKPSIYAYGKLVLWSMDSLPPSLKDLSASKIQHIALANPKMAPYGIAAKELLKRIQLWDTLQHKLVYGESILQTNQFVSTNAAEVGFTSKSTVLNTQLKRTGTWTEIDPQLYPKIEQGVVILKSEVSKEKMASQFYEYLFSKEIQDLLLDYGYMITPNE